MIELVVDAAAPRHWDYILTCFEPVTRVSGGIGTYTRLLLEQLHGLEIKGRPINMLFITSERQRADELVKFCPRTSIMYIPEQVKLGSSPLNNLGDPYRHFGVGMMRAMRMLERLGHSFGYLETPDYSAEGYYALKARRFGLLHFERTGVRLHSPLFMLHEDNDAMPWCDNSAYRFHDMERYCIAHADDVLFGGDAMRDRVLSHLTPEAARSARDRSVKIPHPWPAEHQSRTAFRLRRTPRLAYIGRLEFRKGVDLLVEAAAAALEKSDFELHFFGRDTNTWRQGSMRAQLDRLISDHPRKKRFIFHDYVPQQELWSDHLPGMDGFVFPSRFENYPNVLLEVLSFGRPTFVSSFGCMPEMGAKFPTVTSFNPFDREEFTHLLRTGLSGKVKAADYSRISSGMNSRLVEGYRELFAKPAPRARKPGKQPSIAFVIAHYNQSKLLGDCLESVAGEMRAGDQIIVIDDCSKPHETQAAARLVKAAGHTFLKTPVNSGPSRARNLGIAHSTCDAIYIVDADDLLEPGSTAPLRLRLAADESLEVVSGFFQAFEDEHHAWAAYDPIPETILLENSTHCGILARKSVFDRLGSYSDGQREHFEDWELTMRWALAGVRFEIAPIVTYRYRVQKRTSRNNTRLDRAGYSYEHALKRALTTAPEKLDWARIARFLPSLVIRRDGNATPSSSHLPREVRYEVADRINLLMKPTPLHQPLKQVMAWGLKLRN